MLDFTGSDMTKAGFTANNTGLPEELTGLEDHAVVARMKEKGGSMDGIGRAKKRNYISVVHDNYYAVSTLAAANDS